MLQTYEQNAQCVLAHMNEKQAWSQHGKHVKQIQACNPRGLQTSHYTQRAHITIWAVFWGGRLLLYLMFEFSFIHFVVNVIPLFCAVYFPHFICPNYTFALNPLTHPLIKRIIILLIHEKMMMKYALWLYISFQNDKSWLSDIFSTRNKQDKKVKNWNQSLNVGYNYDTKCFTDFQRTRLLLIFHIEICQTVTWHITFCRPG